MEIPLDQSFYAITEIKLEKIEEDILSGIPFDYLRGESEFYQDKFFVNPSVLIPRPETEFLVDMIVNQHADQETFFADIGTGSGCIGLSLLSAKKKWKGNLIDISPEALEVAKTNGRNLKLMDRAEFILSDRLSAVSHKFDLIVSNPPYIKASTHRHLVQGSVNDYEPHLALYIEDEKYEEWFEQFFKEIHSHLKPNGFFYMEGHELELQSQGKKLSELGFKNVEVIQDLARRDRFLKAII